MSWDYFSNLFSPPVDNLDTTYGYEERRRKERLRLQGVPAGMSNPQSSQFDSEVLGLFKELPPERVKQILVDNANQNMGGAGLRSETPSVGGRPADVAGSDTTRSLGPRDSSGDGFSAEDEQKLWGTKPRGYLGQIGNRVGTAALDMGSGLVYGGGALADDLMGSAADLVGADRQAQNYYARAKGLREQRESDRSVIAAQADKAAGGGLKELGQGFREGILPGVAAVGLNVADQVPQMAASMGVAKLIGLAGQAVGELPMAASALIKMARAGGPGAAVAKKELLHRGVVAAATGAPGALSETLDTYGRGRDAGGGVGTGLAVLGVQTAISAAADSFGLDKVTSGALSKALGKDILEEATENVATGFGKKVGKGVLNLGKAVTSEGGTEMFQEGVGIASEMALGLDTPNKMARLLEAGTMGAIMGGSMHGLWSSGEVSADKMAEWREKRARERAGLPEPPPVVGVIDDSAPTGPASQAPPVKQVVDPLAEAAAAFQIDDLDPTSGSAFMAEVRKRYAQVGTASTALVTQNLEKSIGEVSSNINVDVSSRVGPGATTEQYLAARRDALASMFEFGSDEMLNKAAANDQAIGALILDEHKRQLGAMMHVRLRQKFDGKVAPEEVVTALADLSKYTRPPLRGGHAAETEEEVEVHVPIEQSIQEVGDALEERLSSNPPAPEPPTLEELHTQVAPTTPIAPKRKRAKRDPNAPKKPRKPKPSTKLIEQQLELEIASGIRKDPDTLGQDPNEDFEIEFLDQDSDGDQSMAHGDSATSPEAINRLKRVRFSAVDLSGNEYPMANTVDAIDARLPKGHIKLSRGANGQVTIEHQDGRPTGAQARTLTQLMSGELSQGPLIQPKFPEPVKRGIRQEAVAKARAAAAAIRAGENRRAMGNARYWDAKNRVAADPTEGNLAAVPGKDRDAVRAGVVDLLQRDQAKREATIGRTQTPNARATEKQSLVDDGNLETVQDSTKRDPNLRGWKGGGERTDVTDRQDRNLGPSGDDGSRTGRQTASDPLVPMTIDGVAYQVRKSDVMGAQVGATLNGKVSKELFKHIIEQTGTPVVDPHEMIRMALSRGYVAGRDAYNAKKFQTDLVELFKLSEAEAQEIMNVTAARASALGLSTDKYVAARISHLRVGSEKDTGHAQGWRGSVRFLGDQRAVITALRKPDVTTVLHELGHIWRREISALDPKAAAIIAEASGVQRSAKVDRDVNRHTSMSDQDFESRRPKRSDVHTSGKGKGQPMYPTEADYKAAERAHAEARIARNDRSWVATKPAPEFEQPFGKWSREAEEKWAQMVETYFKTGIAPSPKLETTFAKLKDWFTGIYGALMSNERRFPNLSPEVRDVMDKLLVERAKKNAKAAGIKPIPNPMVPEEELGQPEVSRPLDAWMVDMQGEKTPDNFFQAMKKNWHGFVREMVDKQDYLGRAGKLMVSSGKFSDDFTKQMKHAADRMRTASMGAMYVLHRGTRRYTDDGYVRTGDGLSQILKGVTKGQFEDISRLMNAERHLEILGRKHTAEAQFLADKAAWQAAQATGQRVGKEPERGDYGADIGFDFSTKEAKEKLEAAIQTRNQIIADYGPQGVAELQARINQIRDWSVRAILDPLEEVGRISAQQKANILAKNRKYVTFDYVDDADFDPSELLDSAIGDSLPKMFTGISAAAQVDPLMAMTQKAMAVQYVVERQRVINSLTKAARSNPDLFPELKVNVSSGGAHPKNPRAVKNSVEITEWVDGQKYTWSANHEIAQALDMLDPATAGLFSKICRGLTTFKRKMTTSTPIFALRNMIRDQPAASSNSKYGYIPFVDFYRGVFKAIAGVDPEAGMDPEQQKLLDEFFRNNAGLADIVSVDLENQVATVDTLINAKSPHTYGGHWQAANDRKGIQKLYAKSMAPFEHMSQQLEMGTRIGAYMNARKKGATMNEAAEEAREITLDFSRKGRSGGRWNRYEAFINAAIQDVAKLHRNLTESPGSFLLRSFANFTVPALINAWANGDDEEYQALPEWQKALAFHIRIGDKFIPIPRPIGLLPTIMGYGVEKMLTFMNGNAAAPGQVFNALRNSIPAGSSIPMIFRGEQFELDLGVSADLAPDFAQPLVDVIANQDSFRDGRSISPTAEQKIDPTQRGGLGTTGALSEGISKATGGMFDPYQVEYMAGQYGGTMGRLGYGIADEAARSAIPSGTNVPMVERPLSQRLGLTVPRSIGFSSRPVLDLMAVNRQMTMVKDTLEKHLTTGNSSAYTAYVSTPEAKRAAEHMDQVAGVVSYINGRRDLLTLARQDGSPEAKAFAIQLEQEVTQAAMFMMKQLNPGAYADPLSQLRGPQIARIEKKGQ